ncbi:unnamed protein product [Linum trigynum]|uniref:Uncharacterized protein n=1 Tax=Linum trigynum TaxID=586398 RepID=A0AAV2ELX2_9ROSI
MKPRTRTRGLSSLYLCSHGPAQATIRYLTYNISIRSHEPVEEERFDKEKKGRRLTERRETNQGRLSFSIEAGEEIHPPVATAGHRIHHLLYAAGRSAIACGFRSLPVFPGRRPPPPAATAAGSFAAEEEQREKNRPPPDRYRPLLSLLSPPRFFCSRHPPESKRGKTLKR